MSRFKSQYVDAAELKKWLHDDKEIALFDVREEGQYGEGHPFYAVSLPYSRLELDILRLAPCFTTRIVLFDEGGNVAERAAKAAGSMGYCNIYILQGGIGAWQVAGYTLIAGVHVPSKAFGELVELRCRTPHLTALQLAAMLASERPPVVIDGRPFDEYQKMSIPGASCCPNGELAYRIRDIVADSNIPIVVNCAGRTRSIIGAQTLINIGISNPVYALQNGTQGWFLDDLPLEHAANRCYPKRQTATASKESRQGVRSLEQRQPIPRVTVEAASIMLADGGRSTFLCDVRTSEEFAACSVPGAQHTPGGQLIQATDQYIGVRRARILLLDADGVRAPVVASWLRQMGHDAYVVEGGIHAALSKNVNAHRDNSCKLPFLAHLSPLEAVSLHSDRSAIFVDVRASIAYRQAHIADSRWSIRPMLPRDLADVNTTQRIVLAGTPALCQLAAIELINLGYATLNLLEGSIEEWISAGLPVIQDSESLPDERCVDFLFFVHDRHAGSKESARRYLEWETHLLEQLDESELATFQLTA